MADPAENLAKSLQSLNKELKGAIASLGAASKILGSLEQGTDKASQGIGKLGKNLASLGDGFSHSVGNVIHFGSSITGLATSMAGLDLSFNALIRSAREYRVSIFELSRTAKVLGQDFSTVQNNMDALHNATNAANSTIRLSKQECAAFAATLQKNATTATLTREEFASLGKALSTEFLGNMSKVNEVLGQLQQVCEQDSSALSNMMHNMSPVQVLEYVGTMESLNKMTQQQGDIFLRTYNAMRTGSDEWDDETRHAAEVEASYKNLKTAIDDLVLSVGDKLIPIMKTINEILTSVMDACAGLSPEITKVGIAIAGAMALVLPFAGMASAVLLPLLGPIGLIAAGLVAIGAAAAGAYYIMSRPPKPPPLPKIVLPEAKGPKVDLGARNAQKLEEQKLKILGQQTQALEGVNRAYQTELDYMLKIKFNSAAAGDIVDKQLLTLDQQQASKSKELETYKKLVGEGMTLENVEERVNAIATNSGWTEERKLNYLSVQVQKLQKIQQLEADMFNIDSQRAQKELDRFKVFEADLTLARSATDLAKSQLAITKAMFLGMGPQIEQMQATVDSLQIQKDIMAQQLELAQHNMKIGKAYNLNLIEARKLKTEINRLTVEQLEMTKDLREGYLDALNAFTNASGMMAKIIGRREAAMGALLRKGMAVSGLRAGGVGEGAGLNAPAAAFRAGTGELSYSGASAWEKVVRARGGGAIADLTKIRPHVGEKAALGGADQQAALFAKEIPNKVEKGTEIGAEKGVIKGFEKSKGIKAGSHSGSAIVRETKTAAAAVATIAKTAIEAVITATTAATTATTTTTTEIRKPKEPTGAEKATEINAALRKPKEYNPYSKGKDDLENYDPTGITSTAKEIGTMGVEVAKKIPGAFANVVDQVWGSLKAVAGEKSDYRHVGHGANVLSGAGDRSIAEIEMNQNVSFIQEDRARRAKEKEQKDEKNLLKKTMKGIIPEERPVSLIPRTPEENTKKRNEQAWSKLVDQLVLETGALTEQGKIQTEQGKQQVEQAKKQTVQAEQQIDQAKQTTKNTEEIKNEATKKEGVGDTLSKEDKETAAFLGMNEKDYKEYIGKENKMKADAARVQKGFTDNPITAPADAGIGIGLKGRRAAVATTGKGIRKLTASQIASAKAAISGEVNNGL